MGRLCLFPKERIIGAEIDDLNLSPCDFRMWSSLHILLSVLPPISILPRLNSSYSNLTPSLYFSPPLRHSSLTTSSLKSQVYLDRICPIFGFVLEICVFQARILDQGNQGFYFIFLFFLFTEIKRYHDSFRTTIF